MRNKAGSLLVPTGFSLDGEYLVSPQESPVAERPAAGILDHFVRMADDDAEAVLAFARKFGFLHQPEWAGTNFRERLWDWRFYAASVRAIRDITARLNDDVRPPASLFEPLGINPRGMRLNQMRAYIAGLVDGMIRLAGLRPEFRWDSTAGAWQYSLAAEAESGCFPAIVRRLIEEITPRDNLALCSYCQRSYHVARKPQAGRLNFCPTCRPVAWRLSKQRLARGDRKWTRGDLTLANTLATPDKKQAKIRGNEKKTRRRLSD